MSAVIETFVCQQHSLRVVGRQQKDFYMLKSLFS